MSILFKCVSAGAVAALALIVSGHPAQAEGPESGFYAAGFGGYERYGLNVKFDGQKFDAGHISGGSGGGILGWDLVVDKGHLSVEAEFGVSGASDSETLDLGGDIFTFGLDIKNSYGLAARYGYEFGDDVMAFVRVGWTRTKAKISATGPDLDESIKFTVDGVSIGGGVEWFLSDKVSLRGEYIFTKYENISNFPDLLLKPKRSAVRGGIALRF